MALEIKLNSDNVKTEYDAKSNKREKKGGMRFKWKIIIILLIIMLLLSLCCVFGGLHLADRFGIDISPINPFGARAELKKDSTGKYTNALLVGLDSRGEGSGLQNTDTIILLSYNHETDNTVLLSIPRDFFVKVPSQNRYTKINAIYSIGERQEPGNGLNKLQETVEDLTNTEIQYHAMVDLVAFTKLIDKVGGITVDVENSFTDHKYPVEGEIHSTNQAQGRYMTVSFEEGEQVMDGERALKFVRSRKSLDNQEGSDFARAKRQQRVLIALKEKLLSSEGLLNPRIAFDVLNILEDHIEYSAISNRDIQAFINTLQKEDLTNYTFVLNPTIAQGQVLTDRGLVQDAYSIGPVQGLGKYDDLHAYLSYVFEYPAIYSEEPSISVYDIGLGTNKSIEKTEELQTKLPYIDIYFSNTLRNDKSGIYIFSNLPQEDTDLTNEISEALDINKIEDPEFLEANELTGDYVILLGEETKEESRDVSN